MIERVSGILRRVDVFSETLPPIDTEQLQGKMNDVIDAFYIGQRAGNNISKTVVFGKHRVGRSIAELQKSHIPHRPPDFDYFYDVCDPNIPFLRRGIWVSPQGVKIYESFTGDNGEQIIYTSPKTPDEISKLVDSFNAMPQFPGDLRIED